MTRDNGEIARLALMLPSHTGLDEIMHWIQSDRRSIMLSPRSGEDHKSIATGDSLQHTGKYRYSLVHQKVVCFHRGAVGRLSTYYVETISPVSSG